MRNTLLAGVAAIGFVLVSVSAQAASISIIGGTSGTIPSGTQTNEALQPVFGISSSGPAYGYYGAQISSAASLFNITFYGAEAGFINQFRVNGSTLFSNTPGNTYGMAPVTASNVAVGMTGGYLDFSFISQGFGLDQNGSNPYNTVPNAPNFFATFNPSNASVPTGGDAVYLFFDDAGAGDDDNHDDMLIRISAVPVPEPASLALFGAGLLGLGLVRRGHRAR